VLVADADLQLCGIFTDGDLRRTLQQCGEAGRDIMKLRVEEAMSRRPKTCSSGQMAIDAMQVCWWAPAVGCVHGLRVCGGQFVRRRLMDVCHGGIELDAKQRYSCPDDARYPLPAQPLASYSCLPPAEHGGRAQGDCAASG
jgi:hypothetical protein